MCCISVTDLGSAIEVHLLATVRFTVRSTLSGKRRYMRSKDSGQAAEITPKKEIPERYPCSRAHHAGC